MEKKELIHTKVIYILGNDVTAAQICSNNCPTPVASAFAGYPPNNELNNKLRQLDPQDQSIAIICGDNFGCPPASNSAEAALLGYNLTIIAKSIDQAFFAYCDDKLKPKLIQNTDLIVGIADGVGIDNIDVGDDLEIQSFKVIKKKNRDNDDQDNEHTKEKDDKLK